MKKIISKIFLIITVTLLFTACDSYLDPGYDEYLDKNEVFTSYTYSLNYIRTIYSYLPYDQWDEAVISDEAKYCIDGSSYQIMNNGSWDSRTYIQAWRWSHYYSGIRRVHVFLENVDQAIFLDPNTYKLTPWVNDTMRVQLRAEARFLRAFYYFELLKRFGDPSKDLGVPIVPERTLGITDTLDFKRNTYDECVNYIVADCDAAALKLPNRQTSVDYGKASKAAALALKSRLLLYAASPLANPTGDVVKWKLAIAAAKAVLKLPTYKLISKADASTDNMLGIFTKPNNDEVLFSSPVVQTNSFEANNLPPGYSGGGQINPTQELVDAFETIFGYPTSDIPNSKYDATNPYYRRDVRLSNFIMLNGTKLSATATVSVDSYVGGKDGLNSRQGATKTGYYIRKFIDPTADIINNRTIATHFWVHFRLAEIWLNYAEAVNAVYGPNTAPPDTTFTAYDALKKIRERTNIASPTTMKALSKESFMERVKNERRVELCFEGHRFWDVRRWNEGVKYFNVPIHGMEITKTATNTFTYNIIKVEDRVFEPKMNFMPIPYSEMQKSTLLLQNSEW
jgi:hypothetical protein